MDRHSFSKSLHDSVFMTTGFRKTVRMGNG